MKSNLLSLAVASAFAGMAAGCNPAPKPDGDPDRYRATVDFTSRHLEPGRVHPDRFFYQTPDVQFGIAMLTHSDGRQSSVGFLTCVELEAELTEQDIALNRPVRVTIRDEEDPRIVIIGTIDASQLSPAPWMEPQNCRGWVSMDETPTSYPRIEKRSVNPFSGAAAPVPI